VKKIRQLIKGDRNEQKPVRELEVLPVSWQNVTEAVAKVWGDPWETASRRHGDPARGIAMLVGRQFAGMSLRQIGEAIESLSYPAVSDAARRTTAHLERDRSLQKRLGRALRYLNL
jgi:chromosomal replication initiation ATPase DnaA